MKFVLIIILTLIFRINSINKSTKQFAKISEIPQETEKNICLKEMHSPINITTPFEYTDFELKFDFKNIPLTKMKKIKNGVFLSEAIFGEINYLGIIFEMKSFYLKFSSEHRIGNLGYSLEMQLEGESNKSQNIVVSLLFEVRTDYENKKISNLYLNKKINLLETNKAYVVKNLNMSDLFFDKKRFYMYKGQSTNFPCKFSLVFVALDTEFIGMQQMGGFLLSQQAVNKIVEKKPNVIYQNFLPLENNYLVNKMINSVVIFHSDFPCPLEYSEFSYNPTNNTLSKLGMIPNDLQKYRPFWLPPKKYAVIPNFLFINGFKFFTFFYEFNQSSKLWEQRLVIVPEDFFPDDNIPAFIPVLIRSNSMIENNNVRSLNMINMPVIYEVEKNILKNDGNTENGQSLDTEKDDKILDQSKKDFDELDENFYGNILEFCIEIKLDAILNLPINDELTLTKFNDDSEKKFNVDKYCLKKYKYDIYKLFHFTGKYDVHFINNYCDIHLHVILNKQRNDTLADYIEKECFDMKKKYQNLSKMGKIFQFFLKDNSINN